MSWWIECAHVDQVWRRSIAATSAHYVSLSPRLDANLIYAQSAVSGATAKIVQTANQTVDDDIEFKYLRYEFHVAVAFPHG